MSDDLILETVPLGFPWVTADPFLFCVHHLDAYPKGNADQGPAATLAGRDLGQDFEGKDGWRMYHGLSVPGFPQHPHRGFETITIMRRGLVDHSDSLGATARFGAGDVQWMTAGKGVVHSEMFPLVKEDADNPLELFQIWLNLPKKSKLVEPYFSMFWRHTIPARSFTDAQGRRTDVVVIAGALEGAAPPKPPPDSWASQPGADVAIWTVTMQPGAQWTMPQAPEGAHRMLYVFEGTELRVGGGAVKRGTGALVRDGVPLPLTAGDAKVDLLVLQGRPIGEPVAHYGPFVMNTRAELQQAFADYQRTQFGGWPWKRDDPVHERAQGRFAKHADGRVEERDD